MIKIAFIGSRTFEDEGLARHVILNIRDHVGDDFICVSGGAKGADKMCQDICKDVTGNDPIIFKPDWKKYGKGAGMIRNEYIIKESDGVVAFWDGKSKGTKNSIDHAKRLDKPLFIIDFEKLNNPRDILDYDIKDISQAF